MNSITGAPVTAAVFAGLTILLSGCIAYDAASTVVRRGDVGGHRHRGCDVVTSPFGSDDSPKKKMSPWAGLTRPSRRRSDDADG